jgi:hypothetical protein
LAAAAASTAWCGTSPRAARGLDIANPVGLPPSFTLVIQTNQFMRRCHPVWSSDNRIGVAFD